MSRYAILKTSYFENTRRNKIVELANRKEDLDELLEDKIQLLEYYQPELEETRLPEYRIVKVFGKLSDLFSFPAEYFGKEGLDTDGILDEIENRGLRLAYTNDNEWYAIE